MLLRDNVYSVIRRAIFTLEFLPGQELREQVLAERYRVSRSPVRDTLLRLEQEGLLKVLSRRGYRINTISIRDVEDMYDLCLLVEPACAAGAAQAEDTVVATLDRFRYFCDESGSISACIDYNRVFHAAIADICGNGRLAVIEHNLVEEFDRLTRYNTRSVVLLEVRPLVREHTAVIDAIQAHDVQKAAQLTQAHVATRMMPVVAAFRARIEEENKTGQLSTTTR